MTSPPMPTLRLDIQRAWRQSEDAILLPIVYDLPGINPANPDAMIVQIAAPSLPAAPAEVLNLEEKRRNLALLKKRAETGDFRAPKNRYKDQAEIDPSFASTEPKKFKHLSKSVPLLLLGVIALVLFAWMAFR